MMSKDGEAEDCGGKEKSVSDKPVWMEEFEFAPGRLPMIMVNDDEGSMYALRSGAHARENHLRHAEEMLPARARLMASAPALVRALLLVEWNGCDPVMSESTCPECCAGDMHESDCILDAALQRAGFEDQPSRDAAREMIRNSKP